VRWRHENWWLKQCQSASLLRECRKTDVKPETRNRQCETGELGTGELTRFPFLISGFLFLIPFGRGSDQFIDALPPGEDEGEGMYPEGEGSQTAQATVPPRSSVPRPRGFLARLLAPYLFTLVAVAVALYMYSDRVVENFYVDTLSENVLRQARLAGDLLPWDLRGPAMDQRCAAIGAEIGARVTVIAADGTVLGDSEAPSAKLENHGQRPEVQAALATGEGQAVRTSVSVNRHLFYRAWRQTRVHDGESEPRVVRLSVSMRSIEEARGHIGAAIWGGVGLAALAALWPALVLSGRLSRRVSRLTEFSSAVAAGVTPPALAPENADIIGQLEANLLAMADSLKAQLRAARAAGGLCGRCLSR